MRNFIERKRVKFCAGIFHIHPYYKQYKKYCQINLDYFEH